MKKVTCDPTVADELIDLQQDPGERRNIPAQNPDTVAELVALVEDHLVQAQLASVSLRQIC